MKDYYEIYCTVSYKDRAEEHMTVNMWGNSEEDALSKARIMVRERLGTADGRTEIGCEISGMFPQTLEEFIYEALRKSLTGRKKKIQGVITLKDMNIYLLDTYGIKNNDIKEVAANIIMEKDTAGAVAYFKGFLGIRAEMFMGKFELTEKQLLDYEKEGILEFAYEEAYGKKKTRYYKPDAFYRENIQSEPYDSVMDDAQSDCLCQGNI